MRIGLGLALTMVGWTQYWQRVKTIMGTSLIGHWPLWDTVGSISAVDISGHAHNGVPANVTFGAAGMRDGRTAASFNGTSSSINVFSTALRDLFNGQEGTVIIGGKVSDAAVWADAAERHFFMFYGDTNNRVRIRRPAAANTINFYYRAGGSNAEITMNPINTLDWMCLGFTWSKTANEMKAWYNGVQQGSTIAVPTWNAAALATATIGSWDAANFWKGGLPHCILGNRALTSAEMAICTRYAPGNSGAVAIQFDDAYASVYSTVFPLMQARGLKGTAYVPQSAVGTAGKMTEANLLEMYAAGWDIANHLVDEVDLTTLTETQQEAQFTGCRDYLDGLGLTRASRHVAYTAGENNADTLTAMAATGMLTGRTVVSQIYDPPTVANLYQIPSPNPDALTTALSGLKIAKASGGVYGYHQHNIGAGADLSVANFTTWLDFIVANNIPALTVSEVYARLTA